MNYSSVWPAFGCLAVLLLLAQSPLMKVANAPPSPSAHRVSSIDGARGFLAFGVFFHHVVITYGYLKSGVWALPASNFYRMLGPLAVDLFFMITAYLFWTKAINERGRMNLSKLYIGRLFRIGPLYLFAICAMLAIVFARTGFRLNQPPAIVARDVAGWLALGFVYPHQVNNYANTNRILAGVTWTLYYEWMFYLSLAVTSFLALGRRRPIVLISVAYAASLLCTEFAVQRDPLAVTPACVSLFLAGMLCATLHSQHLLLRAKPWIRSILSSALVTLVLTTKSNPNSALPIILASLLFYLLVSGSTLFGMLTTRAAHRIGNISYGIYLLQGLVLTLGTAPPVLRQFAIRSPLHYWTFALGCAIVLTAVATATHIWIERPGIDLGRRVVATFERQIQVPFKGISNL